MTRFSEWFDTLYRERGYETDAAAARAIGVQQSLIRRWREGSAPSVDNLRKISYALAVPMQQVMIAAEYLTPDEAAVVTVPAPLESVPSAQLIGELVRRLAAYEAVDPVQGENVGGEVRAMRSSHPADPTVPTWRPAVTRR
ncbi:helix-turn-helix domain-containing protein [Rhodococcus aetherivorans]|uniref:helix-turn-helix domain-containing protein n=1 Tax=Rhodococcus aetherivorans TaxID=191292 RepID=UPI00045CF645|nr:helix-turn-helix transcriptional regulator [Rhodococcus aetherivorans]KDE14918.1 hypothetical protein N505_0102075 [Rhodococcus aetherivorans]